MMQSRFLVYGKVQGVWFRESTRRLAVQLGLSGHAINLPDGSVEVLAKGEEAELAQLAAWLHKGPPKARVEKVVQQECADHIAGDFTTG
jgi:acylphosphatase